MDVKDRIPIFPSPGSLISMKFRLNCARKGHRLLQKKCDALTMRFRGVMEKIVEIKTYMMGNLMKEAAFTLAEARFSYGGLNQMILEDVTRAQIKTHKKTQNIAGVSLPIFEAFENAGDSYIFLGLGRGGQHLSRTKSIYQKVVKLLVDLASLQSAYFILDGVIKSTKRRVKALECLVIPRMERTISYIMTELDEMEREDFYRLKKARGTKRFIGVGLDAKKAAYVQVQEFHDIDEDILF